MEASSSPGAGILETSLDFSFGLNDAGYSDRTLRLEIVDDDDAKREHHKDPLSKRNLKRRRRRIKDLPINARVKIIHINSLILAARSRFFRKLFSNGMRESEQKQVTIRIQTLEEDSLMDLLKYVYSNKLPTISRALLNLLVIADKFEVVSCSRACTQFLQNMSMTCELASLYLDLPSSLVMSPTVQPLVDMAKQFLIAHFNDFDKRKEEILNLSLAGIQVVLSSDELQVTSEGVVYDSVLKWVHKHYPDSEEDRRGILKIHLLDLVRFPFMTIPQLTEEVQTCSDIDPELASHIVIRALCFKAETPHRKRCLAMEESNVVSWQSCQFVERAYKYRPIKVVEVESPHQYCIAFLHLTRKELTRIYPIGQIMSETFHLGKQEFVLDGKCCFDKRTSAHYFRLALKVVGSTTFFPVKYEIAVRKKPSEEFVRWNGGSFAFTEKVNSGQVASVWWTTLMCHSSSYFINDVVHVKAELTIKK